MKKMLLGISVFVALSLVSWGTALAQPLGNPGAAGQDQQSWTGVVSDSHCGAKHSEAGKAAATCVGKCVAGGASYVLVSDGNVYQLDNQDKFKKLAGRSVTVTGTMNGDTINVASVHHASKMKM